MQHQKQAVNIVQRLISEHTFREAAQKAFQQADQSQSTDLLQRCRALNACIRQGFVQQYVQQVDSASDSDICSDDSSEDSNIAESPTDDQSSISSSAAVADQLASSTPLTVQKCRPTLVQHAAAATIQRRFRQHINPKSIQGSAKHCRPSVKVPTEIHDQFPLEVEASIQQQQHKAASCIQMWWRCCVARRWHVPLTPPCAHQTQMTCSPLQSSRPDNAASSSPSEVEQLSGGNVHKGGCLPEAHSSFAGLAQVRVSSAAKLRRWKSSVALASQAPIKPAAMLVVQRTTDRAQQVQAMEQQKWLDAQSCL